MQYLPFAQSHVSLLHWLRLALQRMDARVLELMAHHPGVALGLSRLAARGQLSAALLHITRHLPVEGARLTDLARQAGMTKQAMSAFVSECEVWGLVERIPTATDARARWIQFTELGQSWLRAYHEAVQQAQEELKATVGTEVATVIALGLEAYAG
jgi:DNA-binding MarR family transcriptional regulator